MTKGIFVRISEEAYQKLKEEAAKQNKSVYRVIREILEEYSRGRLRMITPEEEVALRMMVKISPLKEKVKHLEEDVQNIKNTFEDMRRRLYSLMQLVEEVLVMQQKIKSLEKRVHNLERKG